MNTMDELTLNDLDRVINEIVDGTVDVLQGTKMLWYIKDKDLKNFQLKIKEHPNFHKMVKLVAVVIAGRETEAGDNELYEAYQKFLTIKRAEAEKDLREGDVVRGPND